MSEELAEGLAGYDGTCKPIAMMKSKCVRARQTGNRGFSMLELTVVIFILFLIVAISMPNAMLAVHTQRLRWATNDFSGLLQQARMRAVQDDRYYSVFLKVTGNLQEEFVDIYPQSVNGASGTGGTTITAPDPVIELTNEVTQQPASEAPNTSNLLSGFLGTNVAGLTPKDGNSISSPVTFGTQGLPCLPLAITGGSICNSRGGLVAYWVFFQDAVTQNWQAVTVTPAGRIQKWYYSGTAWIGI